MKKTGIVILTIALIAAICGSFYVVNDKSKRANQKEKVLTEVQRITTKDLDKNYPQTPREVVKLYNRIVKCYYGMQYSDEELDALTDQALKLFDDELAANNHNHIAYLAVFAPRPAFNLKSSIVVSDSTDSDGCYTVESVPGNDGGLYVKNNGLWVRAV